MAILNLITYKKMKGITSTTKDVEISQSISAVNSYIPSYCNREFTAYYATDKTEYFDGVNNKEIFPDVYPLVSITTVKVSTDGGQTYPTTLAEYTDYVVDLKNSSIVSNVACFVSSDIPTNSVEVVYKGGYLKVPEDLQLAATHLVEYYLEEQYTPKKAFSGVNIENVSILDNSARLPAHIRRVLEHYRSLNI